LLTQKFGVFAKLKSFLEANQQHEDITKEEASVIYRKSQVVSIKIFIIRDLLILISSMAGCISLKVTLLKIMRIHQI